jgi:hypothetical protein
LLRLGFSPRGFLINWFTVGICRSRLRVNTRLHTKNKYGGQPQWQSANA